MLLSETLSPQSRLIALLWSLLFVKCFTLEYLVQLHNVPINSATYVWTLSCAMATAASFAYLKLEFSLEKLSQSISPRTCLSLLAALAIVSMITFGLITKRITEIPLLMSLSLLAATFQLTLTPGPSQLKSESALAGIWLVGTYAITQVGNAERLLVVAIAILLSATLPMLFAQVKHRKAIKDALSALRQ